MVSLYGDIPEETVSKNITDLINQIFKLLPYKEYNDERLAYHFSTILFRITGMANLFEDYPEWLTVICLLESARNETDFRLYRKAILDSCSIVKTLQDKVGDNHA